MPRTVSAGFDAAEGDDLGECHVSPAGFAHMTHMLCSLAGGKVVVALEVSVRVMVRYYVFVDLLSQGGYCLDAIAASALAVTQIILGDMPPALPPLVASETATETIWQVALEQSKYWKNVDPKACEPIEGNDSTCGLPRLLDLTPSLQRWNRSRYLSLVNVTSLQRNCSC